MEKIDLTQILKDCPEGTTLYSSLLGKVTFIRIEPDDKYPILLKDCGGLNFHLTKEGFFNSYYDTECFLWPSKDCRDWSKFKAPLPHKHFEPYDRVIVEDNFGGWGYVADFYSHYDGNKSLHVTASGRRIEDGSIMSYEGNKDKLGKLNKNETTRQT